MLPPGHGRRRWLREHRIYQADWLLRFYGFSVKELFTEKSQNLDPDLDPKVTWALRNLDQFPVEVNRASYDTLMRIPGIGAVSARRIVRQRRLSAVKFDDLKKMGVVLKRAKYFLTCSGRYYGEKRLSQRSSVTLFSRWKTDCRCPSLTTSGIGWKKEPARKSYRLRDCCKEASHG